MTNRIGRACDRKLSSGHFAFMRAVVQGIDARASWDRYLAVEGDHLDLRRVKSTIAWIRQAFAAAATRHARPGTARLVLMDATQLEETVRLPSLAEFALERGLEDFSEAEQQEAYLDAYGAGGGRRASRRARLIERQLEALHWLEQLVAQEPGAGDGVAAWFAPSIAVRLEQAGLATLADLFARVNGVGARWWTSVAGVGELKAARIVEWLRLHEPSTGLAIGNHVLVRRTALQPAELDRVVARATAVVPFEKFLLPVELDGRQGRFRAPLHQCLLEARNDYEAIAAWLATKHDPKVGRVGSGNTATHRAYRKEAERLLPLVDPRAGQAAVVSHRRGRQRLQGVPGRAAGALVRATPPPALVAALAAAGRPARHGGAAPGGGDPQEPLHLSGQPELPDRQRLCGGVVAEGARAERSARAGRSPSGSGTRSRRGWTRWWERQATRAVH